MDQTQLHRQKSTFRPVDTYEKIKRLLDFEDGQKLNILDVGCGAGILDEYLGGLGHKVVGLDIFKNQDAKKSGFIQCDINFIWPVDDKTFDIVVCADVPEHMYDPKHILRESLRVLKNEGKVIFGVPNHFDIRQRFRMLLGRGIVHWDHLRYGEKSWSYAHIRFFTLGELLMMFNEEKWMAQKIQLNFMGGGIIPGRLIPSFIRTILVCWWPNLFSGKFIFLLGQNKDAVMQEAEYICLSKTPLGL